MLKKYKPSLIYTLIKNAKNNGQKKFLLDGDFINCNSQRYKVFIKNHICVTCGLEGKYYKKTFTLEGCHINLYGVKNGKEILITKDHIIPKSKGGKNIFSNYQCMCSPCNSKKGNN